MSAASAFHDFICWATNGTIEAYLSRMAQLAADTADTDTRLSRWLAEERARFYPGAVIQLESVLTEPLLVEQFSRLFGRATDEFLAGQAFTEAGEQWLRSEPAKLQHHLSIAAA